VAEQTTGGFRERIFFEAPLWQEIEALGNHLKLPPRELVKLLTALGLIQMKNISMIDHASRAMKAAQVVLEQDMTDDFERLTGIDANTPVMDVGQRNQRVPSRN
jgi:hypothetical protein